MEHDYFEDGFDAFLSSQRREPPEGLSAEERADWLRGYDAGTGDANPDTADPADRYAHPDDMRFEGEIPESRMATAEEKAEAFDDMVDGEVEDPDEGQNESGSDQPAPRRRS